MNATDFLRPGKGPDLRPIYAVFGDEDYFRRAALDRIARTALGESDESVGLSRLPGAQAELADVLDELRTLPFLSRRRVVVVEEADPFVTAHRKELEAYAERPSSTGVLVLLVKTWPATTRLAKLVEKVGVAVECRAPRESDLPAWLVQLARDRSAARLEADAARLLVELVGPEPGLLASEVEKLAVAVGPDRPIRREDVARWVEAGRIETVWEMLDAATTGQAAEALRALDQLLGAGEPPVKLVAAVTSSLLKVHHAGVLRARRLDLRAACREAGIRDFAAEKAGQQHAHLGPDRVDSLPADLLQADLDLKGSSTLDPRAQLERLLIRWARPRADRPGGGGLR